MAKTARRKNTAQNLASRLTAREIGIGIFVLALIVRVVFVFQWNATPYGAVPLLDALAYDEWAQNIAKGHLLQSRAFYQSPLYPYLLAVIYKIFGHKLLAASLFNAVLSAGACTVLGIIAFEAFGVEAALAAGILATFTRSFVFYSAPVMKEPLGLLLLALFLLFALRALRDNRLRDFIWSGLFLGFCALVRGNALVFIIPFIALAFWQQRATAVKNSAVFLAMLILAIAPATIHNAIASHDFVPVNYDDGFNLYIGHSPDSDGTSYVFPSGIASDPRREDLDVTMAANQEAKRDLKPSEVSSFWRNKAFNFIITHPKQELTLLVAKLGAFWSGNETFDNYDMTFIAHNFGTILTLLPGLWLLSLLAIFAAAALGREHRRTVLIVAIFGGTYMLSVLLFYVTGRYRLPILVFLLPLAGAAIPRGWQLIKEKANRRLAIASACALATLIASFWPFASKADLSAYNWGVISTMESDAGHDHAAIDALNKGLSIQPGQVGTDAYIKSSMSAERLGDRNGAEKLLQFAMKLHPEDGTPVYNYGRLQAAAGDLPAAMSSFEKAEELSPTFMLSYYGMAMVQAKRGDFPGALDSVQRGLKIDVSDPLLNQLLGPLQAKINAESGTIGH